VARGDLFHLNIYREEVTKADIALVYRFFCLCVYRRRRSAHEDWSSPISGGSLYLIWSNFGHGFGFESLCPQIVSMIINSYGEALTSSGSVIMDISEREAGCV
jgi:hypothetical protein